MEEEREDLRPEPDAAEEPAETETAGTAEPAPEPTEDTEALRRALEEAQGRVTRMERERVLLSQGVSEEDLDYYVFQIGRLVTEEKDFAAAAKEYWKRHGARHAAPLSTGASLAGRVARPQTTSEVMNRLLRGN